ncbi:MAG: response regulator, partial [Lachnospiraceae bacterium]|nr:response regulator [Lachnospiraceae bacterium]
DTGQGIKKENLDTIFSSFTRVNEKKNRNIEGTGLGLSITKYLVELMGGTINVDSEFKKGSTFTVILPIKPIGHDDMGSIEEASKGDSARGAEDIFMAPDAKILIVDDSKVNLSVIKGLLKNSKMSIDTASSGMECLEKCQREKYDLILMDHLMPEMDGIETFKNLRASNYMSKDVKVAIVTANAYGDIKDEFMETGFDAYLSKPIQIKELNEMLLELLPMGFIGKLEK